MYACIVVAVRGWTRDKLPASLGSFRSLEFNFCFGHSDLIDWHDCTRYRSLHGLVSILFIFLGYWFVALFLSFSLPPRFYFLILLWNGTNLWYSAFQFGLFLWRRSVLLNSPGSLSSLSIDSRSLLFIVVVESRIYEKAHFFYTLEGTV